jgi:hypothetical protein
MGSPRAPYYLEQVRRTPFRDLQSLGRIYIKGRWPLAF